MVLGYNVSTTGWIAMKSSTDIHLPLRVNWKSFDPPDSSISHHQVNMFNLSNILEDNEDNSEDNNEDNNRRWLLGYSFYYYVVEMGLNLATHLFMLSFLTTHFSWQ